MLFVCYSPALRLSFSPVGISSGSINALVVNISIFGAKWHQIHTNYGRHQILNVSLSRKEQWFIECRVAARSSWRIVFLFSF